jgi:alkylation response protein AidB-like acyl-CoA dehydrogenase
MMLAYSVPLQLSRLFRTNSLAQGCPATALTFNMHIAAVESLMDDPQVPSPIKQRIATLVVQEQKLLAYSVSEPGASSLALGPSLASSVQARRVPGGYTLRGRKSFLSMVEGCDYIELLAHPEEEANPLVGLMFLLPYPIPGQRIEEVWNTLGMRGTRSNNLVLEDCFVPDANLLFRIPDFTTWFTTTPMWGIGFSYTPVYLGVGAAAYHRACEIVKQRIPRGFAQPLSYHPDIRRRVAEMSADLEAARLLMYQAAWTFDTLGMTPATLSGFLRAKYVVGEAVARITRSALTACGAHALFKTSPLEQLFRDGASAPIMPPTSDFCLDAVGMLELGLNPAEMLPPLKGAK